MIDLMLNSYSANRSPSSRPSSFYFTAQLAILALTLLLAACSSGQSSSDRQPLISATYQIAQEYAQNQNLELARQQLAALDVANSEQWLVYVTESVLDRPTESGTDPQTVAALIRLVSDLGLETQNIIDHAIQLNLRAAPPAVVVAAPTTDPANVVAPAVAPEVAAASAPVDTPTPTPVLVESTPAPVAEPPTAEAPTSTPQPENAVVFADGNLNVRAGPGTEYAIAGSLQAGQEAKVLAKNGAGDWWQIVLQDGAQGWVYAPLVNTKGDINGVLVAANIPPPPPTNTPAPVPPTNTPLPPEPTAPPAPSGPDFRLVEHRLWTVEETGGHLAGTSVNCGEKHELYVIVLDANGNRLDGVTVGSLYTAEEQVTGVKGPGTAEFVLYPPGNDVRVKRDTDGREVSSDPAAAPVDPRAIAHNVLIGGRFCTDEADCARFASLPGCYGHYTWTATYQRNY